MNRRWDNRTSYQDAQTGEHACLAHAPSTPRIPRPAPQGPGRRERHLRPARPADRLGRADAVGARRRPEGRRGLALALEGPQARPHLGAARDATSPARRRARPVGRCPERPEAAPPRRILAPALGADARAGGRDARRDPGRARRQAAHARGAGRRGRARDRDQGAGRQAQGRLRRSAQAGRLPRRPLLRAERRPARALRAARPVARPLEADGRRGGDARGRAPVPDALRPGQPRGSRALVRDARRRPRPAAG